MSELHVYMCQSPATGGGPEFGLGRGVRGGQKYIGENFMGGSKCGLN